MGGDWCENWQNDGVGADAGTDDATEDCAEMVRPSDQRMMFRHAMKEVMRMIRNKKLAEAVTAALAKEQDATQWQSEVLTNLKQLRV